MLPPDQLAEYRRKQAVWEEKTAGIRAKIAALLEPASRKRYAGLLRQVPARNSGDDPEAAGRSARPRMADVRQGQAVSGNRRRRCGQAAEGRTEEARTTRCKAELAQFDDIKPGELPEGIGHARPRPQRAGHAHPGAWASTNAPKEEVQPGFLTLARSGAGEDRAARRASNPPAAAPRWRTGSPIPRIR